MRNAKEPLISIVMATYNGELYVEKQLKSIINQTYKNIEIIICDDASTDNTIEIVEKLFDERVFLLKNHKNTGFVKNFETALKAAGGEFIALSDQDDIWEKNKIERLLQEIGNFDLIHSNCSLIDDKDNEISQKWMSHEKFFTKINDLLLFNNVTGCTMMVRRESLIRALPFPKGLAYHDWWLAINAAEGNGIKFLDESLVRYRQHQYQDTGANSTSGILVKLSSVQKKLRKKISEKQLANLASIDIENFKKFDQKNLDFAIIFHKKLMTGLIHPTAAYMYWKKFGTKKAGSRKYFLMNVFRYFLW